MTSRRFLLVEEDPLLAASIARAIVQLGGTVDATTNADAARQKLREGPYVAILVELSLVGVEGDPLALLREARERQPQAHIVIMGVAETGQATALAARALAEDAAHEFLGKPFGWQLIERIVTRGNGGPRES